MTDTSTAMTDMSCALKQYKALSWESWKESLNTFTSDKLSAGGGARQAIENETKSQHSLPRQVLQYKVGHIGQPGQYNP